MVLIHQGKLVAATLILVLVMADAWIFWLPIFKVQKVPAKSHRPVKHQPKHSNGPSSKNKKPTFPFNQPCQGPHCNSFGGRFRQFWKRPGQESPGGQKPQGLRNNIFGFGFLASNPRGKGRGPPGSGPSSTPQKIIGRRLNLVSQQSQSQKSPTNNAITSPPMIPFDSYMSNNYQYEY